MARRVEVGAHVVRGHDVLRVHAVLGFALDVFHFGGRIVGPKGAPLVQGLGEIIQLHGTSDGYSAECGIRNAEWQCEARSPARLPTSIPHSAFAHYSFLPARSKARPSARRVRTATNWRR